MNQFDANAQFRSCQKLLSAVVALAIEDAQIAPLTYGRKKEAHRPMDLALTAIRFLFTEDSDGYLVALDMDPEQFRKRLINKMYYSKADFNIYKNPKAFRFNYEYFYKYHTTIDFELMDKEKETK